MLGVLLVVLLAGRSESATPDALPAMVGWRSTESRPLGADPLRLLSEGSGATVRAEWAPLYRDARGGRYEWARQEFEWRGEVRSAMLGLAVLGERSALRGEEPAGWVGSDAGGPPRVAVVWAERFGPVALAGAAGAGAGWIPGLSLAGSVERGPGWRAEFEWSHWASSGRYDVRYADARVLAQARWLEQRLECGVRGPTAAGDIELRVSSLDHTAGDNVARDVVDPLLGWRSVMVAWAPRVLSGRTLVRVEHGQGRSGFSASRDGAHFADAGGGVWNDIASIQVRPQQVNWSLRGWAGRWRSDPGGDLATWPFVELTLLTGTRLYASSTANLGHVGASFDLIRPSASWEAGLSALWVRPRLSYESWQGPLFGLGRSDYTSGSLAIDSAWLAGLRLCAHRSLGASVARVELVQWLPVLVSRVPGSSAIGGGTVGGSGGGGASGGESTWGGTLVRLSMSVR